MAEIKALGDQIELAEAQLEVSRQQLESMVGKIGNLVDDSVPVSKDEDKVSTTSSHVVNLAVMINA